MLRLRPSEITLTPTDIHETRRRMARRPDPAPVTLSTRAPRQPTKRPMGPRLRPGPARSRDDAIASLGNIPIQEPHHAILASTQDESDEELFAEPDTIRHDSVNNPASFSGSEESEDRAPGNRTQASPMSAPMQYTQLPSRPLVRETERSDHRGISPDQNSASQLDKDGVAVSPLNPCFGLAGRGRVSPGTSDDIADGIMLPRSPVLTNSTRAIQRDPTTGDTRPERNALRSLRQHSSHAPSPLQQAQTMSSPNRPGIQGGQSNMAYPGDVMHLQGYFVSPERYTFREVEGPRTEPRRRSYRTFSTQAPSSSDAPRWRARLPTFSGEDEFWMERGEGIEQRPHSPGEPLSMPSRRQSLEERVRHRVHNVTETLQSRYRDLLGRQHRGIDGSSSVAQSTHRASQHLSEASSGSSQPYSYYELPRSRHTSSEEQGLEQQGDGAASPRHLTTGIYRSVRPSQIQLPESRPRPLAHRISSYSSPNLTAPRGQQGLSPSPGSPYNRTQSTEGSPRPAAGLVTLADFSHGGGRDATLAIERDLPSPLDLLEQRAASQLSRMSSATSGAPSQSASRQPSMYREQVVCPQAVPSSRRSSRTEIGRMHADRYVQDRTYYNDRYEGPNDSHLGPRRPGRHVDIVSPQPVRRRATGARPSQRSSENLPSEYEPYALISNARTVREPSNSLHGDFQRGGQHQSPPIAVSSNMPRITDRHDHPGRSQLRSPYHSSPRRSPNNRARNDTAYASSSVTPPQTSRGPTHQLSTALANIRPYRSPPAQGQHAPEVEPLRRLPVRLPGTPHSFRERQTAPQVSSERHPRPSVLARELQVGSGNVIPSTSRTTTSRRPVLPTHQLDQENSGDAEAELMREEMLAVGMRYAEDGQQLDVLEETPPRLGRFERHMMG